MAIEEKRVKYWELYIDGEFSGYTRRETPTIGHGFILSFADPEFSETQGMREAHISHWRTVPVYE